MPRKNHEERMEFMSRAKEAARVHAGKSAEYWSEAGQCAVQEKLWNTAASFFKRAAQVAKNPGDRARFHRYIEYAHDMGEKHGKKTQQSAGTG